MDRIVPSYFPKSYEFFCELNTGMGIVCKVLKTVVGDFTALLCLFSA